MHLLWSGHLASGLDWGEGNGARSLDGPPRNHLVKLAPPGEEQEDSRGIQVAAVRPPLSAPTPVPPTQPLPAHQLPRPTGDLNCNCGDSIGLELCRCS